MRQTTHKRRRKPLIVQGLLKCPMIPDSCQNQAQPQSPTRRSRDSIGKQPDAPVPMASGIYEFDPDTLTTDAKAFQYKSDADDVGVTERLQGVKKWDALKSGVAIIYERKDGTRVVADGHQRLGAWRSVSRPEGQSPRINGRLIREVDGYTVADVREMSALKNIAEGTGTAYDAATVLRDSSDPDAALEELPPRSSLVRNARDIARLDEEAFAMAKGAKLPAEHVAVVGRVAEGDGPLQEALIKEFSDRKPPNAAAGRSAWLTLFKEDRTGNEKTEDMFGETRGGYELLS